MTQTANKNKQSGHSLPLILLLESRGCNYHCYDPLHFQDNMFATTCLIVIVNEIKQLLTLVVREMDAILNME